MLHDLHFSLYLLLKSADDLYTGILKYIIKTEGCVYLYTYIFLLFKVVLNFVVN
jgi:hypothetical protein